MPLPRRTAVYTKNPLGVRFDELRPEQEATLPVGLER